MTTYICNIIAQIAYKGAFALNDLIIHLFKELERLINDYYRCNDVFVKKQIQSDIQLLSEAMVICSA